MKSIRKSSKTTLVVFVLAIAMLLVSAVEGSKAALTYFSDEYTAQIATQDIGVTLYEQDKPVAWRNYTGSDWDTQEGTLLSGLKDEQIVFGKAYDEKLTVKNTGTIGEYVRVTIYTYWEDKDGNKDVSVSPKLIDVNYIKNSGWLIDTKASTSERTVLYYSKLLGTKEESSPLADKVTVYVDKNMVNNVTQTETVSEDNGVTYKHYVTTYDYDGYKFVIEATVDAVQDHNAEDAAKAVWGRDVSVSNGTLTLK